MNLQLINREPKIGDLVFLSKSEIRNPSNPWCIGLLKGISREGFAIAYEIEVAHEIGSAEPSFYSSCLVISEEQKLVITDFFASIPSESSMLTICKMVRALEDPVQASFLRQFFDFAPF